MKLLSSLKQKKRYVLFEIVSNTQFTLKEAQDEVDKAILLFLGQLGLSKASPLFLKERFKDNKFIIKVNHNWVDELISGVILIKSIKNTPIIIRSIITSGTLKKIGGKL
ncbi:MAG: Rpp14/Pop5 family protein [Candidatus Woesearchaeota archaeon]